MERSHDLEQINAMANTTNSMVELCAQLAVAKAEQGAQIAQLNTKIDRLTKMVEKLATPTPTTTPDNGENRTFQKVQKKPRNRNVLGGR